MHLMAQGVLESDLIHVHSHTWAFLFDFTFLPFYFDLIFTVLFHFPLLMHPEQNAELDNLITMQHNLRTSANKGSNDAYDVHTSLTWSSEGFSMVLDTVKLKNRKSTV